MMAMACYAMTVFVDAMDTYQKGKGPGFAYHYQNDIFIQTGSDSKLGPCVCYRCLEGTENLTISHMATFIRKHSPLNISKVRSQK